MRIPIFVLFCLFTFASLAVAINPPAAAQAGNVNNDAAVAAVVTFLAGAGMWFVVLGLASDRERSR